MAGRLKVTRLWAALRSLGGYRLFRWSVLASCWAVVWCLQPTEGLTKEGKKKGRFSVVGSIMVIL